MINIYQIKPSDEDIVKANAQGFAAAVKVEVKAKLMFGSKGWDKTFFKLFDKVCAADTDDLEEAFELTNVWAETWKITRFTTLSSTSVGDIFEKDGKFFMVDSFGFSEVEVA